MVLGNFLADADILWDRAGKTLFEKPEARTGRIMRVQVTNRGVVEDLTGYTLNLGWKSTIDETKFGLDAFTASDITKGIFELEYTSGMLTNIGVLKAALQLVPTVGNTVESNNFAITVTRSAVDPTAVQSESSFSALTTALVQVNNWNTTIDGKVTAWEGDMAATKQTYIDTMNDVEATYPQQLTSLESQLAAKADKAEVANGLTAKGAVLYASLPTTGNAVGDYYYCSDGDGINPAGNYVWNGTSWYFGGTGDNGYNQVTETLLNVINQIKSKNLIDNTKLTSGAILNTGATYVGGSYENYSYTDYIPVDVGTQLIFSSNQTKALCSVRWIAAFDSGKNILSTLGSSVNTNYFVIPAGVSFVRLTFNTAVYSAEIQAEVSDVVEYTGYEPYGTDILLKDEVMPEWVASKAEIPVIDPLVKAYLPPEICCAVDRTIELYNNQVCINAEKYHLRWKCNIGSAMERKFSITAKESHLASRSSSAIPFGWYYLDLYIYDDKETQLWYGRTMLKIVADSKPIKKILPIGDSLTNWKRWLPEVKKLSGDGINFVGTRVSGIDYSADGTAYQQGTIHHEGRSGFSASGYLANTDYTFDTRFDGIGDSKTNPFWDGAKFSLSHYLAVQTGVATPDAVQIYLGANGNDDQVANAQNIAQMVTLIRAEYPTIPIFVINTIYRSTQDGYASIGSDGYATSTGADAWRYDEDDKIQNLMIKLNTLLQNQSDVHIISLAVTHDTQYNFGNQQTKVNPRSEQVEYLPIESVHPQAQGYFQMADMIYSAYCCHLV